MLSSVLLHAIIFVIGNKPYILSVNLDYPDHALDQDSKNIH